MIVFVCEHIVCLNILCVCMCVLCGDISNHSHQHMAQIKVGVCKQWTGLLDWNTGLVDYWTALNILRSCVSTGSL